jgi:hypothetical protein
MADHKPQRVTIPSEGVHVLPFMSSPAILSKQAQPRFLVVELTPVEKEKPTEARCHIPMTREDAVRLAILIAEHAMQNDWPLPKGSVIRRTIQ